MKIEGGKKTCRHEKLHKVVKKKKKHFWLNLYSLKKESFDHLSHLEYLYYIFSFGFQL